MKQGIKILTQFLLLFTALCCLIFHNILIYGISQGKGQLAIVINAKPIDELLQQENCSDSVKQKLILIQEIKQFAIDSLGINPSENYSSYYDQTNQQKLLTISACEPFSFKAKEWTFPFLGTVSYKGFFNAEKAKKEILKLKQHNFDVDVYTPSGWSTLGWFNDPVLSGMLKRNDGQLANLIIHELTHGTLYVKDNVTFNENLSNFIGDKGAQQFLIYKYGKTSKQYATYFQNKNDEAIYNEYILKSKSRLDSLYKTMNDQQDDLIKKKLKKELILEIVLGVNRLPLAKRKGYFEYTLQAFSEGNAFFMAFDRYDSQYEVFEAEYSKNFNSNLSNYLHFLKDKYPSL
ncbi:MAG: aminopeptidase [Bacteroidetes bacterium]|nr:aminopeptidase [Bacteroidota bacterium]